MDGVVRAYRALGRETLPFSWSGRDGQRRLRLLGVATPRRRGAKLARAGPDPLTLTWRGGRSLSVLRVSTLRGGGAYNVTREDKDRLGILAYGISGLRSLRQTRVIEYLISLDGQPRFTVEGILAFITAKPGRAT